MLDAIALTFIKMQSNTLLFIVLAAAFGLVLGSFLNVLIHRIPLIISKESQGTSHPVNPSLLIQAVYSPSQPRSACPGCGHHISALENIPIISYLLLKGRCSACNMAIRLRYPIVEALTSVLFGLIAWQFGWSGLTVFSFILACSLITYCLIELDSGRPPYEFAPTLVWFGLLCNLGMGFANLQTAIIATLSGFFIITLLDWIFHSNLVTENYADKNLQLIPVIGAWFGLDALPKLILLALCLYLVARLFSFECRKQPHHANLGMGFFIPIAMLVAAFFNDRLENFMLC
jgi:leader peptidase (prepilin peptidase)/N-methyltransferase